MATWREDNTVVAATAANGTLTKPTGTAGGDVLGIFYSLENDIPLEFPNGFIITTNQDHASAAHDQFFAWKRAGAAEGASYVVTHASTWRSGYIVAVQNTSATYNPHGGSANQGTSSTATALAATSSGSDAYVLATYTTFGDMGLITPTGGWNERWDSTNNIYVQDKAMAGAGSAGDAAITFGASQNWMARQFLVEDDGVTTTDPTVIQVKHGAMTATRSPSVTFDFAPLENDIVAFWPSSTVISATLTIPATWNNLLSGTTDVETDSHQLCAVYHRVTSAEAGASTMTFTATNLYGATVTGNVMGVVIRNVDTTTAVDVTSSTFNSTNTVTPHVLQGLTPTVTDGLFMSGVAADAGGIYCVPPTGFDMAATNTNTQGKAVAWRETLTTASVAIANTNIVPSAGDEYASISVVWRKAAGGGGTKAGAATGTITWAGAATGTRTSSGSASGTIARVGAATGGVPRTGAVTGTVSRVGAATGQRVPKGAVTGSLTWADSATGTRTPKGAATGTITWADTATGTRTSRGATTGTMTWAGSAAGEQPGVAANEGAAAGAIAWVGSAAGLAPAVGINDGSASGAVARVGAATGARTPKGASSGTIARVGAATGTRTSRGAVTGTITRVGAATGETPTVGINDGAATGAITRVGAATGRRTSAGAASGAITWADSATGTRPAKGVAVGTITWTGAALGTNVPPGAIIVTGTFTLAYADEPRTLTVSDEPRTLTVSDDDRTLEAIR